MVREKEVVVDGQKIVFHLERKPVKNLNLRIRRDGSVFVSASRAVQYAEIDRFVRSRSRYILTAIQKFEAAVRFNSQTTARKHRTKPQPSNRVRY